ncbi:DUF6881 domain-containing protein [Hahella ganghwensis]|uniref:DUF6881 domain-containing protein n=1 Tax=Hahella ganghwensis TaxID=286420 RepID=UPI00037E7079|nr:hypothetical protein [Hahella ganghwensis]
MSTYIYSQWISTPAGYPKEFYSELDPNRYETRKVEIFADGKMTYASTQKSIAPTRLGIAPVPTLAEIRSQTEFAVREITKQDFEKVWIEAIK